MKITAKAAAMRKTMRKTTRMTLKKTRDATFADPEGAPLTGYHCGLRLS
jgi:hypothetical protein